MNIFKYFCIYFVWNRFCVIIRNVNVDNYFWIIACVESNKTNLMLWQSGKLIKKKKISRERPFNLKGGGYGFFLKKYSDYGGGKILPYNLMLNSWKKIF